MTMTKTKLNSLAEYASQFKWKGWCKLPNRALRNISHDYSSLEALCDWSYKGAPTNDNLPPSKQMNRFLKTVLDSPPRTAQEFCQIAVISIPMFRNCLTRFRRDPNYHITVINNPGSKPLYTMSKVRG